MTSESDDVDSYGHSIGGKALVSSRPLANRATTHLLIVVISLIAIFGAIAMTVNSQSQNTSKAESSFRSSVAASASFISTFLHQRAEQQGQLAQGTLKAHGPSKPAQPGYLAEPFVNQDVFDEFSSVFGYLGGVVTAGNNVVATYPKSFGLVLLGEFNSSSGSGSGSGSSTSGSSSSGSGSSSGSSTSGSSSSGSGSSTSGSSHNFEHYLAFPRSISTALKDNRPAISNVKLVSINGITPQAVVVVSSPYKTILHTTRVVTGYYVIQDTPLGPFLADVNTDSAHQTYLVDEYGNLILASPYRVASNKVVNLRSVNSKLALAVAKKSKGTYSDGQGRVFYYSSITVAGTRWKVIITEPFDILLNAGVKNRHSYLVWLAVLAFVIAIGVADLFLYRFLHERDRLSSLTKELDLVSRLDVLTELYNRRHIDEQFKAMIASAKRYGHPITLLIIDIDHFKSINDRWGHEIGDETLIELAKRLTNAVRPGDLIGRWGGEEFVAILPMTDSEGGGQVAERIRLQIASEPFRSGTDVELQVTVSVGLACQIGEAIEEERLLKLADDALYEAKEGGRNRVVCASVIVE